MKLPRPENNKNAVQLPFQKYEGLLYSETRGILGKIELSNWRQKLREPLTQHHENYLTIGNSTLWVKEC